MGAAPAWITLALTLPRVDADWLDAFLDGFWRWPTPWRGAGRRRHDARPAVDHGHRAWARAARDGAASRWRAGGRCDLRVGVTGRRGGRLARGARRPGCGARRGRANAAHATGSARAARGAWAWRCAAWPARRSMFPTGWRRTSATCCAPAASARCWKSTRCPHRAPCAPPCGHRGASPPATGGRRRLRALLHRPAAPRAAPGRDRAAPAPAAHAHRHRAADAWPGAARCAGASRCACARAGYDHFA